MIKATVIQKSKTVVIECSGCVNKSTVDKLCELAESKQYRVLIVFKAE